MSKEKVRILLLYVSDMSGHKQAARTIKQALQNSYPEASQEIVHRVMELTTFKEN